MMAYKYPISKKEFNYLLSQLRTVEDKGKNVILISNINRITRLLEHDRFSALHNRNPLLSNKEIEEASSVILKRTKELCDEFVNMRL